MNEFFHWFPYTRDDHHFFFLFSFILCSRNNNNEKQRQQNEEKEEKKMFIYLLLRIRCPSPCTPNVIDNKTQQFICFTNEMSASANGRHEIHRRSDSCLLFFYWNIDLKKQGVLWVCGRGLSFPQKFTWSNLKRKFSRKQKCRSIFRSTVSRSKMVYLIFRKNHKPTKSSSRRFHMEIRLFGAQPGTIHGVDYIAFFLHSVSSRSIVPTVHMIGATQRTLQPVAFFIIIYGMATLTDRL